MKQLITHLRLTVALLIASLLTPAFAQPVQAAPQTGYLWTLTFDFEAGYNGELLLKVGPWQNGALLDVTEKSATTVNCQPVGDVSLGKGYAIFNNGGYLQCDMDIAGALFANHGLFRRFRLPFVDGRHAKPNQRRAHDKSKEQRQNLGGDV